MDNFGPFVIKKVSDRGTSHPVVARLAVQISDLIGMGNFSKIDKDRILSTCFSSLQNRLGECWDTP